MNHPHEDDLLRLAYGELAGTAAADAERHLRSCATCRERFLQLERTRVAAEWALARRPQRRLRWGAVTLAAAAALLVMVMFRARPEPSALSLTLPRYTAPGLAPIDSLLTRLEQEKPYAIP